VITFDGIGRIVQPSDLMDDTALGFGNILAEGSDRAAKTIGHGTDECLITFKGQEAPAHMPQLKPSFAIIYAVNPFGADHQSSEHDPAIEDDFDYYTERLGMIGFKEKQEAQSLSYEKIRFTVITQYLYKCPGLSKPVSICVWSILAVIWPE